MAFGNVFFQQPDPKQVLYGEVRVGQMFTWSGRVYIKTQKGRKVVEGKGRPGNHLDELEIVEI